MEPQIQVRPRRRRWRWVLGIGVGLVLIMVGTYSLLIFQAQRLLVEQLAAYRAAGEPVLPADLDVAPPPDELNAAIDLRAAADRLNRDSEHWTPYYEIPLLLPLTEQERRLFAEAVATHRDSLDLVERARSKPAVHWGVITTAPAIHTPMPDLAGQRLLALFLAWSALHAHERGQDAEALKRVDHLLFQTRAVHHHPMIIGYRVSAGVSAVADSVIEQLAPRLRIAAGKASDPGAATPGQARAIIDALLDDADQRAAIQRAMLWERARIIDLGMAIAEGRMRLDDLFDKRRGPAEVEHPFRSVILAVQPVMKPRQLTETGILADYVTEAAQAMQSQDYPTYRQSRPAIPLPNPAWAPLTHPLFAFALPTWESAATQHYRLLASRRLAAVSLAVRWYALENDGNLPPSLDALTPRYLPSVPLDPLAAGRPLNYSADRAIVWSVGDDGFDNGGSEAPAGPFGTGRWNQQDLVLHLMPQPRPEDEEVE